MSTRYIIEYWNKISRKYVFLWAGQNLAMAEKMYDKPYHKKSTRRLIKITEEVLYQDKANI
jgi:hypothetical protein